MADPTASIDIGSSTNSSGNITCQFSSVGLAIFTITAYSLVFVVGIILNSLAFWVYFCHVPNRNSIIIYLKNLVVADFLLVISLPIRIGAEKKVGSTILREIYCNFTTCIFYLNMYSSILFLGFIAATRYLKIVKPFKIHAFQTLKSARIVSIGIWCVFLSLGVSYMLLSGKKPAQNSTKETCLGFRSGTGIHWHIFLHAGGTFLFLCVLIGLCFFYFQTAKRLDKSPTPSSLKKQAKAKNNILILLVVFLVCFVPYHIARLPYILSQVNVITGCFWEKILYHFKEFAIVLSSLNACLDPVIYFLFCKAFRSKLGLERNSKDSDSCKDQSLQTNPSRTVLDEPTTATSTNSPSTCSCSRLFQFLRRKQKTPEGM
ncbi:P2Y purinoceptor 14-like [Carcharodon carcharias]|uniref:P2Y purinoceptor 14-like n=1 Tax=Carcharodon carcharias TaxID=13397 RepID=UPI001B7E0AB7|nr:P2Y purinoceptor 14-like [Carcharodon carcharias]